MHQRHERQLIAEALRIYFADGIPKDKALEVCTVHLEQWRNGETSRDPVQFARHFVELRHAARGPTERVKATHQRHDPIPLPPGPRP